MTEELNSPICLNLTEQGSGHFVLIEIDSKFGEGGKKFNTLKPRDVILDDKLFGSENSTKLNQIINILTEPNCREVYPRGTLSNERDIVLYLTPHLNEVDSKFKGSKIYMLLKPWVDRVESQEAIIYSMKERAKEIEGALTELMSLELSEKALKKLNQTIDAVKSMSEKEQLRTELSALESKRKI